LTAASTTPPLDAWHSEAAENIARKLSTHVEHGLMPEAFAQRPVEHGPNELRDAPRPPFWKLVLAQFTGFVVIILITASLISALIGEWAETAVILAIVLVNAIIGVLQESKAGEALAAPNASNLLSATASAEANPPLRALRLNAPARWTNPPSRPG
jgi:Ca2+-transporting ATPase